MYSFPNVSHVLLNKFGNWIGQFGTEYAKWTRRLENVLTTCGISEEILGNTARFLGSCAKNTLKLLGREAIRNTANRYVFWIILCIIRCIIGFSL